MTNGQSRQKYQIVNWQTLAFASLIGLCFHGFQTSSSSFHSFIPELIGEPALRALEFNYLFSSDTSRESSLETELPDALRPVSFSGCCSGHFSDFHATCLTEKACNVSYYPFSSPEEASYFKGWELSGKEKMELRQKCLEYAERKPPPTRWCSSEKLPTDEKYPMGCSMNSMGGGSGPYDRALVFPQGKLAFCGIPKAGVTQWLQFLRFTYGAKDYLSVPYFKSDVSYSRLDVLSEEVRDEIWSNTSWTKAIFIRNPAERLLSGYLDKIEGKPVHVGHANVTFAEFIDILAMKNITRLNSKNGPSTGMFTGLSWHTDPHFRPQAWACGLSEELDMFHYVASMDRVAFHTKSLLQQVNMWDSFGRHYRLSNNETNSILTPWKVWPPEPQLQREGEAELGFQQQVGKITDSARMHNTGATSKIDKYYTPELMKRARDVYWMDFALWDALQEADKEGLVHGKDIAKKLNPKCGMQESPLKS